MFQQKKNGAVFEVAEVIPAPSDGKSSHCLWQGELKIY
jgi:hypothetical protein